MNPVSPNPAPALRVLPWAGLDRVWLLSWRHLCHHPGRSLILVLCLSLAVFVPVTVQVLVHRYGQDLVARGASTPLVCGAKGNRFDLTLAALYFRQAELDPIPWAEVDRLAAADLGTAIPLHVRYTARGAPIVGTSPEYYALRRLEAAAGTLPLRLGDAVLGARVAKAMALQPGDALFSDPPDLYDLSRPPAVKMRVSGVLPATATPDDDAVFVDVKTCWILEGFAHGHDAAASVGQEHVLGHKGDRIDLSPALRPHQEITAANAESFHLHGDPGKLPLSAILVVPPDAKAATMLKTRVNTGKHIQMLVPREVIDDLLSAVFKIKVLFDGFALVLGITTFLLLGLQVLLSMRLRAREMATLERIGCSRGIVTALHATEILALLGAALGLAAVAIVVTVAGLPNLVRTL